MKALKMTLDLSSVKNVNNLYFLSFAIKTLVVLVRLNTSEKVSDKNYSPLSYL